MASKKSKKPSERGLGRGLSALMSDVSLTTAAPSAEAEKPKADTPKPEKAKKERSKSSKEDKPRRDRPKRDFKRKDDDPILEPAKEGQKGFGDDVPSFLKR